MPAVEQTVQTRTGKRVQWRTDSAQDRAVDAYVQFTLDHPLTLDAAVQVALLCNPRLQADFEDVGIAQADLVQAGLLSNPGLSVAAKLPDRDPRTLKIDAGLSTNVVDLFFLPLRKRLAGLGLQQAELRAANSVLDLARDVKTAYWTLAATRQAVALQEQSVGAARAAADLGQRLRQAGNVSELELTREQATYQEAELDLQRLRLDEAQQRRELAELLGVTSSDPSLQIASDLADPSATLPDVSQLTTQALDRRLDLTAARRRQESTEANAKLVGLNLIEDARVGVAYERETDHTNLTGPSLDLELPLFDQGQAKQARAAAEVRQARRQTQALEAHVRTEVRLAADRAATAQLLARRYSETVLPLRQRQVHLSQLHYNAMEMTPSELLDIKRQELTARRQALDTTRDYWLAVAQLEHAIAADLPELHTTATTRPATQPSTTPPMEHHHH